VALGQPGISFQSGALPDAAFSTPNYSPIFDGNSGYVDIPQGQLNITQAITITAWVNFSEVSHFSDIIGRGDSSWRMTIEPSGNPGANDSTGNNGDANAPNPIV